MLFYFAPTYFYLSVKPTNTGTVPKGFITENNAAKISVNNSIFFITKINIFDFF